MDSNSIDIKLEKTNAIFRYRRLQSLNTLFRFMEVFVLLILISRFSIHLPFAVRVSADQFKGVISLAVFSPRFVFVIGNVIILILLFKSRVVENGDLNGKVDVYDEYVKRCEKSVVKSSSMSVSTTEIIPIKERKFCRSQSENLMIVNCNENQTHRKLRRSVTERKMWKKIDGCGGETSEQKSCCAQDELSNEEFRRTVEAFIARQQQSLRDEELAPVAYMGA